MRPKELLIGCWTLLFLAAAIQAAPLRELSVQYAMRTDKPPTLDGDLSDPCWQKAPEFTRYRNGMGANHQKTSLRILWDDRGLYFGVKNYEKSLDKLKADIKTRDGGHIWADDSGEFYIDPTCTGYSMFKFEINCVGAVGDWWQVDMGFTDKEWSASSARAASGRTPDAWTIEFFVSWTDLKRTPKSGDLWMLMHVRFLQTDGPISAVSSSGGTFYDRKFGYIYFIDGKTPPPLELGAKLMATATQPWALPVGDDWLLASGGKLELEKPDGIVRRLEAKAAKELDAADALQAKYPDPAQAKALKSLRDRLKKTTEPGAAEFAGMAELDAIAAAAITINDTLSINELTNEEAGK